MTNEQRGRRLDAGLRDDVLGVLQDAATWRLTMWRWSVVADTVAALEAALRDSDADAVRDLVQELKSADSVRATPIDVDPVVPAPDMIRPVLNSLVGALAEDVADGQESHG